VAALPARRELTWRLRPPDQVEHPAELSVRAVAEHRREPLPAGRLLSPLAGRLDQPDPPSDLVRLRIEPLLGFGEHGRRLIQDGDVVARSGQRQRLVSRASADVQDTCGRRREVPQKLSVEDVGAHLPLTDAYASPNGSANAAQTSGGTILSRPIP
jgi:hypothetical protein